MIVRQSKISKEQAVEELNRLTDIVNGYKLEGKSKVTFYFSDNDIKMLNEIYIRRMQSNKKPTKSGIIVEALKMLYRKETNS